MRCDEPTRERIRALVEAFDRYDVEYVVPRGHQSLPESFPGSDLDVLVAVDSFDRAGRVCTDVGLEAGGSAFENTHALLSRGLRQPVAAVRFATESPAELVPYLKRQLAPAEPTRRGLVDRHFRRGALDVHLFNHLAYASPMHGGSIRVDPAVEEAMFDRRRRGRLGFVPAPPDELAHLVCRGVFDYDGRFPPYYARRCDDLVAEVTADSEADDQFRQLLEPLFFQAASLVYDHVVDGSYDEIRSALYRYAAY